MNIVIVGAGYTGIEAQKKLLKSIKDKSKVNVIILDKYDHHSYHGWTNEVIAGDMPIDFSKTYIPSITKGAKFIKSEVESVDLKTKQVFFNENGSSKSISYDHLVIGTGSKDNFDLPGTRQFAWRLKDQDDFSSFIKNINEVFKRFENQLEQVEYTISVIGGGYAGVEAISSLKELAGKYSLDKRIHDIRLVLFTGEEGILKELLNQKRYDLVKHAYKHLSQKDISIISGKRVIGFENQHIILEDGTRFFSDLILTTAGTKTIPINGTEKLFNDRGRIRTDRYLRSIEDSSVWAGGDIAEVYNSYLKTTPPPNALWAMKHGLWIGRNIANTINNKQPREFNFPGLGQSAAFEKGNGITELKGIHFKGKLSWIMRFLFFLWYMPSKSNSIKIIRHYLKV